MAFSLVRSRRASRRTHVIGELPMPGVVLLAGLGVVAALGVLGAVTAHHDLSSRWFDLDGEYNVPAAWSAGLLVAAGALAAVVGRRPAWRAATGLAVLFAFMGLDEAVAIHERLEALTGIDWQLLYVPVVLVGGVAWLALWRRGRTVARFRPALAAGSAAWFVAQVLEKVQWHGDVKAAHYDLMMVLEELLEMTGSLLFLIAVLLVARRVGVRLRATGRG